MIKIYNFSSDPILEAILKDNFQVLSNPQEANVFIIDNIKYNTEFKQQLYAITQQKQCAIILVGNGLQTVFAKIPDNVYRLTYPIYHIEIVKLIKNSYLNELSKSKIFTVNGFTIDVFACTIIYNNQSTNLTSIETKLIKYLLRNKQVDSTEILIKVLNKAKQDTKILENILYRLKSKIKTISTRKLIVFDRKAQCYTFATGNLDTN